MRALEQVLSSSKKSRIFEKGIFKISEYSTMLIFDQLRPTLDNLYNHLTIITIFKSTQKLRNVASKR